jgi:hypothetical protein
MINLRNTDKMRMAEFRRSLFRKLWNNVDTPLIHIVHIKIRILLVDQIVLKDYGPI